MVDVLKSGQYNVPLGYDNVDCYFSLSNDYN